MQSPERLSNIYIPIKANHYLDKKHLIGL